MRIPKPITGRDRGLLASMKQWNKDWEWLRLSFPSNYERIIKRREYEKTISRVCITS